MPDENNQGGGPPSPEMKKRIKILGIILIALILFFGLRTAWNICFAQTGFTEIWTEHEDSAEHMRDRTETAIEAYRIEISSITGYPEYFTNDEVAFIDYIMRDIRSSANARFFETYILSVNSDSRPERKWTENIVEYLELLGYKVDVKNDKISWEE